jgi:hypothetical protein
VIQRRIKKLESLNDEQRLLYHDIRLLIAEKGKYPEFVTSMENLLQAKIGDVSMRRDKLFYDTKKILEDERDSIEETPGIWDALAASLGIWRN